MADAPEMRGRLARLLSELADDLHVVELLGREIASAVHTIPGGDESTLALAAVRIHRYYTAIETVVLRIDRTLAAEPTGSDWHLDLLRGATRELPGIRPAILPKARLGDLHELLRFRHFFRHAYAVDLDDEKLAAVAGRVVAAQADLESSLRGFESFVRDLAARLADGSG